MPKVFDYLTDFTDVYQYVFTCFVVAGRSSGANNLQSRCFDQLPNSCFADASPHARKAPSPN